MSTSEVPPAPEPAVQLGARLLTDGRAHDAVDVLRGVVAEAPIYAAAHVLLAAALDAAGRPDDALDVWHRAAFLVPSSPLVQRERRRLSGAPEPDPSAAATEPPAAASDAAVHEVHESASPGPTAPVPGAPPEPTEPPGRQTHPASDAAAPPQDAPPQDAPPAEASLRPGQDSEPRPSTGEGGEPPAHPNEAAAGAPRDLPEGAHLAPADELFTHPPEELGPRVQNEAPAAAAPSPELASPEPEPAAPAARPTPPPVPDWGDLGDPVLAVLPPQEAEPPPEAAEDPGGWTILAEARRPARPDEPLQPDVVPPEDWAPPSGEATLRTVPGAPTAPSHATAPPPGAPNPTPAPTWPPPAATTAASALPTAPDSSTHDVAEGAPPDAEPALADDLDALIESLEAAPRITPDPDFDAPPPDLDSNVDDLASETLAKIYAAQHQYVEAAVVYERLAARTPEQADALLERAAEMRRNAS